MLINLIRILKILMYIFYYLYAKENQNAMDMFKTTYGLIKDKEEATKLISKAWEWELVRDNKKENLL